MAQMLSDGISYGFGILYVDLMETFHGTSAEVSSIGSLSYGSFCFIGKGLQIQLGSIRHGLASVRLLTKEVCIKKQITKQN